MDIKKDKKILYYCILGLAAGILNGLFGSGGGVAVVPLLEYSGIEPQKSHATSIAIILALSIVSTVFYYINGHINLQEAMWYVPAGLIGAVIGAKLLKKIPNDALRRIFGCVMIFSAVRLLMK